MNIAARNAASARALDEEALRLIDEQLRKLFERRERHAENAQGAQLTDMATGRVATEIGPGGVRMPALLVERYGPDGLVAWVRALGDQLVQRQLAGTWRNNR
jgi:hypothetical protein